MVAWSSICYRNAFKLSSARNLLLGSKTALNSKAINCVSVRNSGHHDTIFVVPTNYMWKKFKDMANFYLLLGIIPLGSLIIYCNIFIGKAELIEIPEGYEPKHWEYHQHPITRFLAKYLPSPQQILETNCHFIFLKQESSQIFKLEKKIKQMMNDRGDYQAWYFKKPMVKYARIQSETAKKTEWDSLGHSPGFVLEK